MAQARLITLFSAFWAVIGSDPLCGLEYFKSRVWEIFTGQAHRLLKLAACLQQQSCRFSNIWPCTSENRFLALGPQNFKSRVWEIFTGQAHLLLKLAACLQQQSCRFSNIRPCTSENRFLALGRQYFKSRVWEIFTGQAHRLLKASNLLQLQSCRFSTIWPLQFRKQLPGLRPTIFQVQSLRNIHRSSPLAAQTCCNSKVADFLRSGLFALHGGTRRVLTQASRVPTVPLETRIASQALLTDACCGMSSDGLVLQH